MARVSKTQLGRPGRSAVEICNPYDVLMLFGGFVEHKFSKTSSHVIVILKEIKNNNNKKYLMENERERERERLPPTHQ